MTAHARHTAQTRPADPAGTAGRTDAPGTDAAGTDAAETDAAETDAAGTDAAETAGSTGPAEHPLIAGLRLAAHPEGGWYRRTWASPDEIPAHGGTRPVATSILFLLQPGEVSAWHRVASAEIWLWQGGGRLTLTLGGAAADPVPGEQITLGPDPSSGDALQAVVPAGHWQTARPLTDDAVLVGCVVAPGFDFADFELHEPDLTPDP